MSNEFELMSKSKSVLNIVSNYGNKLFSLISVFIFIPLYIKYLGIESYAVIGFYSLLLGIISFADSGLSSAIIKEFASTESSQYKYSILRLIEKRYILICITVTALIFLFSPLIAQQWLTSETIPENDLIYFLRLISVGISLQLLSSLYFGSIFGLGFQIEANLLQIIWNIFKSFLVVIALIFIDNNLEVFFIWQIVCNLFYILALRYRVIHHLKNYGLILIVIIKKIPKSILNYVGGMALIAIISSINSQADKIVTSSFFSLKIFGYYTVASTIAQIPVILAMPMTISLFPIISRIVSKSDIDELKTIFIKSTFILNSLIFIAMFALFFYTKELILLWTTNSVEISFRPEVIRSAKFLIIGSSLLALQLMFFYILLSFGKTKYNVMQGVVQILVGIPTLYFFVNKIGMSGGGISWILINLGGLIYLFIIVTKKYIKLNMLNYIYKNYLSPFIISLLVFIAFFYVYKMLSINFIIIIAMSSFFSILLNLLYYNIRNKLSLFNYKNIINLYN